MRRRSMKRIGLISKYSPKVSNVCDISTWALSQAAVDQCCTRRLARSPASVCTLARSAREIATSHGFHFLLAGASRKGILRTIAAAHHQRNQGVCASLKHLVAPRNTLPATLQPVYCNFSFKSGSGVALPQDRRLRRGISSSAPLSAAHHEARAVRGATICDNLRAQKHTNWVLSRPLPASQSRDSLIKSCQRPASTS
jgi:hypothetical protein